MIMPIFKRGVLAASSLAALLSPVPALAWGDEGHKVVALIAEHYLTPEAKAKVDALLLGPALPGHPDDKAEVPDDIADRATWADRYRDSDRRPNDPDSRYSRTREWHFVDLELDGPDLEEACFHHPASDKPFPGVADSCVVDKIRQFSAVLADPAASQDDKTVALEFLLHFVGDVHQPLHAADNHDKGGNAVSVTYSYRDVATTRTKTTNLHAYWDTVTVARLGAEPEMVAASLIADMPKRFTGKWREDDPAMWAQQSFVVAGRTAYRLPKAKAGQPVTITASYAAAATSAARRQLELAGYRLVMLLNTSLGGQ